MKENNIICSKCGAVLSPEEAHEFEGKVFCGECLDDETVLCSCCGERIWRSDTEGDSTVTLCTDCYEERYTVCEGCGALIHNDSAYYEDDGDYPFCRDCFEKFNKSAIKNYSYKPEPIFYGSGNLFYGVELEIDKGGEENENAERLLDIANIREERIYCKHDGSISDGFEIVSHPMSLEYHTNTMNWRDIFEEAVSMDYRSHNTKTCGLHIHCSRRAFGKNYDEQESAIGRMVFFVEKHWNELVKFSRRTPENLGRWAARYATMSNTPKETYTKAKFKNFGRYVAVNLENYATVEFRLFRGTLRYKTFIAALQLVDEICRCAINMTDNETESMSWSDFVRCIPPAKHELIQYLKSKQLYVNDTVTESEEM